MFVVMLEYSTHGAAGLAETNVSWTHHDVLEHIDLHDSADLTAAPIVVLYSPMK